MMSTGASGNPPGSSITNTPGRRLDTCRPHSCGPSTSKPWSLSRSLAPGRRPLIGPLSDMNRSSVGQRDNPHPANCRGPTRSWLLPFARVDPAAVAIYVPALVDVRDAAYDSRPVVLLAQQRLELLG